MPAYLKISAAQHHFKSLLGNANHLIITALVGLDAIERGIVTEVPKELHAAWLPLDPVASSRRSRRMLLDMALVRAVDALDVYIRYSLRKPSLIQSPILRSNIDAAKLSVFKKFLAMEAHYKSIDKILSSLVSLMITWRNQAAHSEDDAKVDERHRKAICENAADIACRFRNLNSNLLLSGYDEHRAPHFKEIASFINATHRYVMSLEQAQFGSLDAEIYLKELVWTAASSSIKDGEKREKARRRRIESIWGKDSSEKQEIVKRFLRHQGLSFDPPKPNKETNSETEKKKKKIEIVPAVFSDEIIESLVSRTPSQVYSWAVPSNEASG